MGEIQSGGLRQELLRPVRTAVRVVLMGVRGWLHGTRRQVSIHGRSTSTVCRLRRQVGQPYVGSPRGRRGGFSRITYAASAMKREFIGGFGTPGQEGPAVSGRFGAARDECSGGDEPAASSHRPVPTEYVTVDRVYAGDPRRPSTAPAAPTTAPPTAPSRSPTTMFAAGLPKNT